MPSMQKGESLPSVPCFTQSVFMSHLGQIVPLNSVALVSKRLFSSSVSNASFRYLPSAILGTPYLAASTPAWMAKYSYSLLEPFELLQLLHIQTRFFSTSGPLWLRGSRCSSVRFAVAPQNMHSSACSFSLRVSAEFFAEEIVCLSGHRLKAQRANC